MPDKRVRVRLRDHLAVCEVLFRTLGNTVFVVGWLLFGFVLSPWMRARNRRALSAPPPQPVDLPAPPPEAWTGRTIEIVAGEASGDRMAAAVVRALRAELPDLDIRALAGPETAAAGARLERNLVQHAMMGVTAVVGSVGMWWRVLAETFARWRVDPPALLLTVDFPGLNQHLVRFAHRRGIVVVHLVVPAFWAHGPWRAARWRKSTDRMLATFPFEAALLEQRAIPVHYVGHPLFEHPGPPVRTSPHMPTLDANAFVELWPGSRLHEVRATGPLLAPLAEHVARARPHVAFVPRLAFAEHRALLAAGWQTAGSNAPALAPHGSAADSRPLLGALACSGTATAELAAQLVPLLGIYRLGRLQRVAAWLGLTAPWILLPNLVAGRRIVPEAFVSSPREVRRRTARLLAPLLDEPQWLAMRRELEDVRRRLVVPGVAQRIARAVLAEGAARFGASAAQRLA